MNIKEMRKKYGLTQIQIARAIGTSELTISNWDRGAMKPNPANAEKLAAFFAEQEKLRREDSK